MFQDFKYKIEILDNSTIDDLINFNIRNCLKIYSEHHDNSGYKYYAYSPHIECLDNKMEISRRVFSLQLLLNGSHSVICKNIIKNPISFSRIISVENFSNFYIDSEKIENFPFAPNFEEIDPLVDINESSTDQIFGLISYSAKYEVVRFILFNAGLFSTNTSKEKILTWISMYKILDLVKHYSKEIGKNYLEYSTKSKITEFTKSCNNLSSIGIYARHGTPGKSSSIDQEKGILVHSENILSMANLFLFDYVKTKSK